MKLVRLTLRPIIFGLALSALALSVLTAMPADAKGGGGGRGGKGASVPSHSGAGANLHRPDAKNPPATPRSKALQDHFANRAHKAQNDPASARTAPPDSRSAKTQRGIRDRVFGALRR